MYIHYGAVNAFFASSMDAIVDVVPVFAVSLAWEALIINPEA